MSEGECNLSEDFQRRYIQHTCQHLEDILLASLNLESNGRAASQPAEHPARQPHLLALTEKVQVCGSAGILAHDSWLSSRQNSDRTRDGAFQSGQSQTRLLLMVLKAGRASPDSVVRQTTTIDEER